MMKWLDARQAVDVGSALALFAAKRIDGRQSPRDVHVLELCSEIVREADRHIVHLTLNVYQKSRLVKSLKRNLRTLGVEEAVAGPICRALLLHLAGPRRPAEAVSEEGVISAVEAQRTRVLQMLERGEHCLRERDYRQAIAVYEQVLSYDSEDVAALNNLAIALCGAGRFKSAEPHLLRAVEANPQFSDSHFNLGYVRRVLGRYSQAEVSIRQAVVLDPKRIGFKVGLAQILSLLGRMEEAETIFADVLRTAPGHQEALVGLGDIARLKGHFEEAEAIYKDVLASYPNISSLWVVLASMRRMTSADGAWLDNALRLLASGLPPMEEVGLRFAIGKYWDDVGNYQSAFSSYEIANNLARSTSVKYNRQARTEYVDDMIRVYSKEVLLKIGAGASPSAQVVLVVGMPRSGTTLVEQIVASHPAATGAGELGFWTEVLLEHAAAIRSGVLDEAVRRELADSYMRLLSDCGANRLRVVDKAPVNSEYLGLIHSVLPNARIIYLKRDPIDTCLSCYFQQLSPSLSYAMDLSDLAHYYREHYRLMQHWRAVLPAETIMDVPYSGLVANPEDWTRRIIDFIGLEWDDHCLEFHKTNRPVVTASNWQVRQRIYSSSLQRWRNYAQFIGPLLELQDLAKNSTRIDAAQPVASAF